MGMEHVYYLANKFIDLIQRKDFLPPGLNVTVMDRAARKGEPETEQLFKEHWQVRVFVGLIQLYEIGGGEGEVLGTYKFLKLIFIIRSTNMTLNF